MKNSILLFYSILLAFGTLMVSCSSDPDFDNLETITPSGEAYSYDAQGIWTQNDINGDLNIDDYIFTHLVQDGFVYGFTPSKATDTEAHEPLFSYPYAAAAGGGINGKPYLVGYWAEWLEGQNCPLDKRTCHIYEEDGDRFQPQSVMVCCNTYLMYELLNGSDFLEKATPGSWVTLNAHGVHLDGTEAEEVFYLVNIEEDSQDIKNGFVLDWTEFSLTGLGTCTDIYFTMDCSSNLKGNYGLNIPCYFCLDRLVVKD